MGRERARLGLERNLLRFVPRQKTLHPVGEELELVRRKITRRAAAEINEVGLASAHGGLARVNRQLLQQRVEVTAHFGRIFVRVNLEITKVAALAAKGNV